ncbi:chymotrypsin-1 [Fopius arisanus]|uniref:Chymotrypsin-1 n=1 Tax=Fopius arisanus TaxID=64838 RepID=A0A0C9PNR7_9HYME|nr:PREDICTED: chymotrypsin-1-like [Fopius arisanus]
MTNSLCFIILLFIIAIHDVKSLNRGRAANIGQFPYVVSIWNENHHHCSGLIYDTTHVITPGHCVNGTSIDKLNVLVGVVNFEYDEKTWHAVQSYVIHPSYRSIDFPHYEDGVIVDDIAVIIVDKPFIFNNRVVPAPISSNISELAREFHPDSDTDSQIDMRSDSDDSGTSFSRSYWPQDYTMVGWDSRLENGIQVLNLQYENVAVYRPYECLDKYDYLSAFELCAGDLSEKAFSSPGDSGTPIVFDDKVIAMVTGGPHVPDGTFVTIILKISPYFSFIQGVASTNQ